MKTKEKLAVAVVAFTAAVGLSGCGDSSMEKAQKNGYVPVDVDFIFDQPQKPITAILGRGIDRVPVQVNSLAACINALYRLREDNFMERIRADNHAVCMNRNGQIEMLVIEGIPYMRSELQAPQALENNQP